MSQKILRTMQDDLKEVKDTKTGGSFFKRTEPVEKENLAPKPLSQPARVPVAASKTKTPAQITPAKTEKGNFTDIKNSLEQKGFNVSLSPIPQGKKKEEKGKDFFAKLQEKITRKKAALREEPRVQSEQKIEKTKEADSIKRAEEVARIKAAENIKRDTEAAKIKATENAKKNEEEIKKKETGNPILNEIRQEREKMRENVMLQIQKREEASKLEVQKAAEALKVQEALRNHEASVAAEALKAQEVKISNILREVSDSLIQGKARAEESEVAIMEKMKVKLLEEERKNKEVILAQIQKQEELRKQEVLGAQEELKKQEALRAQEAKMTQQALQEENAKRAEEALNLRRSIELQEAEIADLVKRTANPLNKEDLIEEMRANIVAEEKKNKEDILAQMKAQEMQLSNFIKEVSNSLRKETPEKEAIEQEIIARIKEEERKTKEDILMQVEMKDAQRQEEERKNKEDILMQVETKDAQREEEAKNLQAMIQEKDTQISNLVKGIADSLQEESEKGEAKEKLIEEMQAKIVKKEDIEQEIIARIKEEERKTKEDILMQVEMKDAQREEEAKNLQAMIQEKDTQISNLVKGIADSLQEESEKGEAKEKLIAEMQEKIMKLEEEKRQKENALAQLKEEEKGKAYKEIRIAEQKIAEEMERLKQNESEEQVDEEREDGLKREEEKGGESRRIEEERLKQEEATKGEEEAEVQAAEEEEVKREEEKKRLGQEEAEEQAAEEEEERLKQEEEKKEQEEAEEQAAKTEEERIAEEERLRQEEAAQKAIQEETSQIEETRETEEPKADTPEIKPDEEENTEERKKKELDSSESFWNSLRKNKSADAEKTGEGLSTEDKPIQDDLATSTATGASKKDEEITDLIKRVSNSMEAPAKNPSEQPGIAKPDKDKDLKNLLSRMSKNLQKEEISDPPEEYLKKNPQSEQDSANTINDDAAYLGNVNRDKSYWEKIHNTIKEPAMSPQQRFMGGTSVGTSPYDIPAEKAAIPGANELTMPEDVRTAQRRIQERRQEESYVDPGNRLIYGKQEFYSTMHKSIKPKIRSASIEGLDGVLKEEDLELGEEEEKKRLRQNIITKYGIKIFTFPWVRVVLITIIFLAIFGGSLMLILPRLKTTTQELPAVVAGNSISDIDKLITAESYAKKSQATTLNYFDANLEPWKKFNSGEIIRLHLTYDNQDVMLSREEALKAVLGDSNASNIPADFLDATASEYNVLVFKESSSSLRLALVFKYTPAKEEEFKDIMSKWEKTNTKSKKIYTVMKNLFVNSRIIEQDTLTFQSALYNNTTLRFVNLPDSDTSMDYFIYDGFIVFTSSKDHTFQMIDKLKS